jgi:transposase
MFVRIKKHPGSKNYSILLCENYRDGKKIQQKIISFLGVTADPAKMLVLKAEGEAFIEQIKTAKLQPKILTDPDCILSLNTYEVTRKNVGIRDILESLYDQLGFSNILRGRKISKVLKSVVLTRFAEPSSKRHASFILERNFNEEVPLDSIYYMMDQLVENLNNSQRIVFKATKEITKGVVDLALFDVTTLHLETVVQDELRNFGFSKNNRVDTTQLVLALATTSSGLPIGYQIFPGNTAEVSTLMACINVWKETINIGQVMLVGDRAMMSKNNITKLQEAGLQYIIAYPMKKASNKIKDIILNKINYTPININNATYLKQEINLAAGEKLIITFSEKRRAKDQHTRDKLITKLRKKLGTTKEAKRLISNKGYLKYTEIDKKVYAEIDEEKIIEESKWDGLHGVISNTTLSGVEIVERYKNLWVIEEAFRINKHNLKMRPVYHYNPMRIQAHIEICFLTFALIKHAQHILKQAGMIISIDELRTELTPIEASILCDRETGKFYRMPSQMTSQAKEIYKIFGKERDLVIQEIAKEDI